MKLFLDTAVLKEIETLASWGVLDGITTNPSLLAKEGKVDIEKHIKTICKWVKGPVSMEVFSTEAEGMVAEGKRYAKWAKNVVVKIPMTAEGLKAIGLLKKVGIRVNVTLIFSANQALLAAKAGADFVSPFVGRLDDYGQDGLELVEEIRTIFDQYAFPTEILVASVRHPRHVTEAAMLGADICTLPYAVFEKLVHHPLTDAGLEKFLADWNSRKK
jgi:transaldolase